MDVLVSVAVHLGVCAARGLWLVIGNYFCGGVTCVLTSLYGVGTGWPLWVVLLFAGAGLAALGLSVRGGVQLWMAGRQRRLSTR